MTLRVLVVHPTEPPEILEVSGDEDLSDFFPCPLTLFLQFRTVYGAVCHLHDQLVHSGVHHWMIDGTPVWGDFLVLKFDPYTGDCVSLDAEDEKLLRRLFTRRDSVFVHRMNHECN